MYTPASGSLRLGIDYGNSNTVAVIQTPDGRLRPLLFDGRPLLPSAVYAEPDGVLLVGRDAQRAARLDPTRYEPNPKRRIDEGDVLLGDAVHPVRALVAAVLRRVAAEAIRVGGQQPESTTLTHPMAWGEKRQALLRGAAADAGLRSLNLVPEPVAAARYFVSNLPACDGPIVVYDLGGGTFDVTVVRPHPCGIDVLGGDGLAGLGGIDLDALVVAQIAAAVADRLPDTWHRLMNPVSAEEHRASLALWQDARAAKETLSRRPTAALVVPLVEEQVHVTREAVEQAAAPLLAETTRLTARTIAGVGLTPDSISGVFLVGGASRTPAVATALHRALGVPPTVLEQPETVVAEGSLLPGEEPDTVRLGEVRRRASVVRQLNRSPVDVTVPTTGGSDVGTLEPLPPQRIECPPGWPDDPVVDDPVVDDPVVDDPAARNPVETSGPYPAVGTGGAMPSAGPAASGRWITAVIRSVLAVSVVGTMGWWGGSWFADAGEPPATPGGTVTPGGTMTSGSTVTPGGTAAPVDGAARPATVTCPEQARLAAAATVMVRERVFETAGSIAYICTDQNDQLWYHGIRRADGASITLTARRDGTDFVAIDEPAPGEVRVEYRVNDHRLTRATPTRVELDEAVTHTG